MIDLREKHTFIVGGSRGIGAATATTAAQAGSVVSLTYRAAGDAAAAVVRSIQEHGGHAQAFQADVQDESQLNAAVDAAVESFGPLHGMVVSAGIYEGCPIEDMSVGFWERIMSVNLRGTFLAVKAAVRHMRASGIQGSIVIYTSTAGQSGSGGGYSAYATSKGAQIVFMRSMAQELAPDRIRVNCVAPAWTETDMAARSIERIGYQELSRRFPLGRIGQPRDIAAATCYLLSDLAAFVTGITLTVDGGMAMRG
jgi:NAD(P)-dependent dehydrogenase (short-subunit alcohol dehydrogenase family)